MVQIIQTCNFFLILIIFFSKFSYGLSDNIRLNEYSSYLSWEYAKNSNDLISLKKFFKNIDLDKMDNLLLEEIFFESVILDDWNKAEKISSILLERDNQNFSANLYKFFNSFIDDKNANLYLKEFKPNFLDSNFLDAIIIWENLNEISHKPNNCVPIICLHSGLFLVQRGESKRAQTFFERIEKEDFASYRIKELLLLNSINSNKNLAEKYLKQINNHDLNLKKFDLSYLAKHKYLLNPIENKTQGMAEVLYNISSWFFTKELYKYSAFFGKISLKLRPDFNAMKLLLTGTFEKLGYQNLGINYIDNQDDENLYYYKFLRIKLSLLEKQNMNNEFISNLTNFIREYPDKIEMKILFADKYRKLEKYKQAVKIYSEIIEEKDLPSRSNILYSRGISYERLNKWDKAERDLKEALRLNPEDAYVLNYLAYSWLDRNKNIDEALKLLKKAIEIEPRDAYIIDSLGWAYYLSNKTEESIYFLEKAVSILPDDATLNDHLGDAYWKAGRKSEALSQWKRVLILDPNFQKKSWINKKINEGL